MLDLSSFVSLPHVWGAIITFAVFLYVLLDGFDLGVGILFPYAPTETAKGEMMMSVAPFWDANETWLVLGGGGLYGTFPIAYAILMPAFYLPIIAMLISLIFRGLAFEVRFKATNRSKKFWSHVFHWSSLAAAFFQGLILAGFIQGVKVENGQFAGGAFDWWTPFGWLTGICVIIAYALLGSTWLIMKMKTDLQKWAKKITIRLLSSVLLCMFAITIWMAETDMEISRRLFTWDMVEMLFFVPLLVAGCAALIVYEVKKKPSAVHYDALPFWASIGLFVSGFMGLAASLWPYVVPYALDFREAAANKYSLSFLLVGMVVMLPVVLFYSGYVYYVFRGKVQSGTHY